MASTSTCSAFDEALARGNAVATPEAYHVPEVAKRAQRWTPRFGYSTNITVLITGDDAESAEQEEYVRGIVTPVIALVGFFVLWVLIILIAKCCGPRRVGFLSGRMKSVQEHDSSNKNVQEAELEAEQGGNETSIQQQTMICNQKRRLFRIRLVALVATLGVLVCCILTSAFGVASFVDSQETTVSGIRQARDLALRAIYIMDRFGHFQNRVVMKINDFFNDTINDSCPNVREVICTLDIPDDIDVPDNVNVPDGYTVPTIRNRNLAERHLQVTQPTGGVDLPPEATVPPGVDLPPEATVPPGVDIPDDFEIPVDLPEGPVDPMEIHDRICNFEGVPFGDFLEPLEKMDLDIYYDQLSEGRQDLVELSDDLDQYADSAETVEWPFYVATAFITLLALLDVMLLISLVYAWWEDRQNEKRMPITTQSEHQNKFREEQSEPIDNDIDVQRKTSPRTDCIGCVVRCSKSWFLIPLFAVVTFICAIIFVVAYVGSAPTSDLCYENPDAIFMAVLEDQKDKFNGSVAYDFLVYYIGGCIATQRPKEIDDQIFTVKEKFQDLGVFLAKLAKDAAEVQEICGADANPVTVASQTLLGELCGAADLLEDVQELFSCENWHSLYRTVVYEAICDQGMKGLHWLALCMVLIVVFALIIITLRVGFYEVMPNAQDDVPSPSKESHHWDEEEDEPTDREMTHRDETGISEL